MFPLAGPPALGPCRCDNRTPDDETIWPERPHSRTKPLYVTRLWCANCEGWISEHDTTEEELAAVPPEGRQAMQWALAAAWTAARVRRSKAQKRRFAQSGARAKHGRATRAGMRRHR